MRDTAVERRSLTPAQRIDVVLKSEELLGTLIKEAKERQTKFHGNRFTGKVDSASMEKKSTNPVRTSEKIADIARTSRVQVDRLRRVKREAPEKYAEVIDGKKSIRKAYDKLPPTRKRKSKRSAVQEGQETTGDQPPTAAVTGCPKSVLPLPSLSVLSSIFGIKT